MATPTETRPPAPERPRLHVLAQRVGELGALDGVAKRIGKAVRNAFPPGAPRDALSGSPLGHALHPLMTDLPIGTWTSATALDAIGGRDAERAARRLVALGVAAALPTAASGLLDWADTEPADDEVRRVGAVHAVANVLALGLYGASLVARRRERLLRVGGAAVLAVGGHLGGHLSYAKGVGVNATAFGPALDDWTDAGSAAELGEGAAVRRSAGGVDVVIVRRAGRLFALAERCTHRGGSLSDGTVDDGCITCPLHGSRFRLEDGSVERGPSPYPQPTYDVREAAGRLELRSAHGRPTL